MMNVVLPFGLAVELGAIVNDEVGGKRMAGCEFQREILKTRN